MHRLLAAALLCAVATGANATEFTPYEAFYEMTVQNWKLPGEVANVTGSQIVRVEKDCTDWTLVGAFRLEASGAQGATTMFATDVSGTEAINGTRLVFRSTTTMNDKVVSKLAGTASRAGVGQAGRVIFTAPEQKTTSLPPEVLFPVASFNFTETQWEKGQKNANYVLFDGTTPDPVRVFEILTGTVTAPNPPPDGDVKLLDGKGWRTSASYHAYEGNGSEPLTTLVQNVMASGVATELSLDIGFADVILRLRRVRALPAPRC